MSYLVPNGLGPAPLQKNLLDTAGTGHSKTLRSFKLWLGINRLGTTEMERIKARISLDK